MGTGAGASSTAAAPPAAPVAPAAPQPSHPIHEALQATSDAALAAELQLQSGDPLGVVDENGRPVIRDRQASLGEMGQSILTQTVSERKRQRESA